MTLHTFLLSLKKTKSEFDWFLSFNSIRSTQKSGKDGHEFCPLSAVSMAKTGQFHSVIYPHKSANEIGLEDEVAKIVVYAADNQMSQVRPPANTQDVIDLRKRMLKVLGLKDGKVLRDGQDDLNNGGETV